MNSRPAELRRLAVQLQAADGRWWSVGDLYNHQERNWFEMDEEYWFGPGRPVLGQVFEDQGPSRTRSASVSLPFWFSHLLPEGVLRKHVAEEVGVKQQREFFLLEYVGESDLPGAVRIIPYDEIAPGGPDPPDVPDRVDVGGFGRSDSLLKFSLAGLQLKFSLLDDREKGLTLPAKGEAGDWIVKIPDQRPGFDRVPEVEAAALSLALACGIEVPEHRLVDGDQIHGLPDWAVAAGTSLAVRRFDRVSPSRRVHMEELAQVLDISTGRENAKYDRANFETVVRVTGAICGLEAAEEALRRIIFNALIGNGDAHTKNWAYIYPDGRNPKLSPIYDILPTILYVSADDLGMNFVGSKSFTDIDMDALRRFERRVDIEGLDVLAVSTAMVERVFEAWPVLKDHLTEEGLRRVTAHRDSLPLSSI